MDNEECLSNRPDSIEVDRNAKGEYSWKIKIYYDSEMTDWNSVSNKIKCIDDRLKKEYKFK